MKHVVLSTAWGYSPTNKAFQISFGLGNSERDFLPLVDVKPVRQLVVKDSSGGFRVVGRSECAGEPVLSVLALPMDAFGYVSDEHTGDLTFVKQDSSSQVECLLFGSCSGGAAVDEESTSGRVLRTYLHSGRDHNTLEFVGVLAAGEKIVIQTTPGRFVEYIWDGIVVSERKSV
jgi:hypothetical protein